MRSEELREALATLDLTQQEAANLLGVSLRTVQAWAIGERDVPEPAARLIRTWIRRPEAFPPAAEELDLGSAVSRTAATGRRP